MKLLLIATIALVCCLYAAQAHQLEKIPENPKTMADASADSPGLLSKSLAEQDGGDIPPPKSLADKNDDSGLAEQTERYGFGLG
uniref:Secreted protein n=1 Tax=Rhodnius prolixus TaxID=13249 RepID=A0A4V0Y8V3_RHOPR